MTNQEYEKRVRELEEEGLTRSDAQGIVDGEELAAMKTANRVEVIDANGRSYTRYLKDGESVKFSLQDDNRTLKIFIDDTNTEI